MKFDVEVRFLGFWVIESDFLPKKVDMTSFYQVTGHGQEQLCGSIDSICSVYFEYLQIFVIFGQIFFLRTNLKTFGKTPNLLYLLLFKYLLLKQAL